MKKQVVLIDLLNAAHRMRHAFETLHTTKGHPTGVLYGMLEMLQQIISGRHPDAVLAVGESPGKSWRAAICTGYKDGRQQRVRSMSAEERADLDSFYRKQIPDMLFLLRGLGIPYVTLPGEGYEADDALAAIVNSELLKTADFTIVSTDRDMLQLARDDLVVRIFNPYTKATVYCNESGALCKDLSDARSNVIAPCPFSFVCRRALIGDPSDSIKGVVGIGEKTAAKIFSTAAQPQPDARRQYMMRHRGAIRKASKRVSADAFSVFLKNMAVMDLTGTMYEAALHRVCSLGTRDLMRQAVLTVEGSVLTYSKAVHPDVEMFLLEPFNPEARLLRFLRVRQFESASKVQTCRAMHRLFAEQHARMIGWWQEVSEDKLQHTDDEDEEEEL